MTKVCRVCLAKSRPMINIFDNTIEPGVQIASRLSEFTEFAVSRGDSFPENICPSCLHDFQIAFHFKEKYERSLNTFKKRLGHQGYFIIPDDEFSTSAEVKPEETDNEFREEEIIVKNEPIDNDLFENEFFQIVKNTDITKLHNVVSSIIKSAQEELISGLKEENKEIKAKLEKLSKDFYTLASKKKHKKDDADEPEGIISFPIKNMAELDKFETMFLPEHKDIYVKKLKVLMSRGPLSKKFKNIMDEYLLTNFNLEGSSGKLSLKSRKAFYSVLEEATKLVYPNDSVRKVLQKAFLNIKNKIIKRNSRLRSEFRQTKNNQKNNDNTITFYNCK